MIEIVWAIGMNYFSEGDERAFFTWLEAISGVQEVKGLGGELVIKFKNHRISESSLRELIGLFTRYDGDLGQLKVFLTDRNTTWFKDPKKYWYSAVFGKKSKQPIRS